MQILKSDMIPDLNITTIQACLFWEDVDANLTYFDTKINDLHNQTDIIVLPEMFTTGFTMKPEQFAEEHGGKGLQWMQQQASKKNCVLVGSIAVKENNVFYNRLYWVMPDTTYKYYDKRHLFRMGKEHAHYQSGKAKLIIEYKGWKICPLICYDLRFPVWARNTHNYTYDILLYVANWPEIRSYPWKQLLIARAIENQVYVIGSNRIGIDGNKINHSGDSCVLTPKGDYLYMATPHTEETHTTTLSYHWLQEFRTQFPVLLDADVFEINA